MPPGRALLIAALAAVAVLEVVGIFTGRDTISALVRDTFHIHTPAGRVAFVTGWVAFAAWFLRHIDQ